MTKVNYFSESEVVFSEHPKNKQFIDMTGLVFGRVIILGFAGQTERGVSTWFCRCECGNITKVEGSSLKRGHTSSCGCLKIETAGVHSITHGHSKKGQPTPEYRTWQAMMERTQNQNTKQYSDYGGRGITVCERWQKFENFLADMGGRPGKGYSLDRKENNKGYFKENCRWATRKEQNNNQRSNVSLTHNGKTQNVSQWADEMGMPAYVLRSRLNLGWPIEKALTTPIKSNKILTFPVNL